MHHFAARRALFSRTSVCALVLSVLVFISHGVANGADPALNANPKEIRFKLVCQIPVRELSQLNQFEQKNRPILGSLCSLDEENSFLLTTADAAYVIDTSLPSVKKCVGRGEVVVQGARVFGENHVIIFSHPFIEVRSKMTLEPQAVIKTEGGFDCGRACAINVNGRDGFAFCSSNKVNILDRETLTLRSYSDEFLSGVRSISGPPGGDWLVVEFLDHCIRYDLTTQSHSALPRLPCSHVNVNNWLSRDGKRCSLIRRDLSIPERESASQFVCETYDTKRWTVISRVLLEDVNVVQQACLFDNGVLFIACDQFKVSEPNKGWPFEMGAIFLDLNSGLKRCKSPDAGLYDFEVCSFTDDGSWMATLLDNTIAVYSVTAK